jgi:hypothetical protein
MSKWRTIAYETFGFRPGAYSHRSGTVELFSDLFAIAQKATHERDELELLRVLNYVQWAAAQHGADGLASAVDLAFFLPGLRDPEMSLMLKSRLPPELFAQKWQALMEEPAEPPDAMDSR